MNVQRTCALAALAALVLVAGCETRGGNASMDDKGSASAGPVTLAVVNARVWTGDTARPWAEAFAVRGDRFATVGSSAAVRKLAGNARVIDAAGRMVVPGFIDSHVHFIDGGFALSSVQLRDARTPAEFIARIKAFAATVPPGAWITGGNWDHEQWGGELPRHDWIDSVTPNNPVWINRLDGHMSLANAAALRAARITRASRDVAGGTRTTLRKRALAACVHRVSELSTLRSK